MLCILRKPWSFAAAIVAVVGSATMPNSASAEFLQQGAKIVGASPVAASGQGSAVALSADGNTMIVGGPEDAAGVGAAWVFVRSNGAWSQQAKLVGTGTVGAARFGASVALSGGGNIAIVGAPGDSSDVGAVWMFTRSNGQWLELYKLVGSGYSGKPKQGTSVAMSSDGLTALVGGPADNGGGAAWAFALSFGTYGQQGPKLTSANGRSLGTAVALSADGNTALIGSPGELVGNTFNVGAARVFIRDNGTWTNTAKLTGTDPVGDSYQGYSVSLSADGRTAIIGGPFDNTIGIDSAGAAWVFTSNGTTWSQQGAKLVATGTYAGAQRGYSVSLSGDGDTAIVSTGLDPGAWVFTRSNGNWSQQGGRLAVTGRNNAVGTDSAVALSHDGSTVAYGEPGDNSNVGASWVFLRRTPHDLSGDGKSDIVWRNGADVAAWTLQGSAVLSSASVASVPTNWSIVGQRDFDGDRKADLLWRDTTGNTLIWFMSGGAVASTASLGNVPPNWSIVGTGDLDGDGKGDLVWRDDLGNTAVWLMDGATIKTPASYGIVSGFSVVAVADFNRTLKDDILWRDNSGNYYFWFMDGTTITSTVFLSSVGGTWFVAATGDFNNDGRADILWRDAAGNTAIWLLGAGGSVASTASLGTVAGGWSIAATGDYNGDGKSEILWRSTSGDTALWFMDGTSVTGSAAVANVPPAWVVQAVNSN